MTQLTFPKAEPLQECGTPEAVKPSRRKRRRRRTRDIPPSQRGGKDGFEHYLRSLGLPYVAVDEAKKAIFAASSLDAFHFLVYRDDGPNHLILVVRRMPTAKQEALLSEWQKVFGADFVSIFIKGFFGKGPWVYLRSQSKGPWAPYPPENPKPQGDQP